MKKYGLREVQYFQPRRNLDTKGVPKDYSAFDEACKHFDTWMTAGYRNRFDTWVLDSSTTLIDASQDKAIILLGSDAYKGAGSKTYEEAKKYGLVSPKKQDFGSERSMTEQFVRMLKDSGKNVVILSHERELTDDSGNVTAIVPLLTGKSQEDVPIMFDEVYRLISKPVGQDVTRTLLTQPDVMHITSRVGSRLGVPNGTLWSYDELKKAVGLVRAAQRKLLEDAAKAAPAPTGTLATPAALEGSRR